MSLGRASHGRRGARGGQRLEPVHQQGIAHQARRALQELRRAGNDDAEQEAEPGHPARVPDANTTEPSQADTLRAAKKLDLSPNLLFRTSTATVFPRQRGPSDATGRRDQLCGSAAPELQHLWHEPAAKAVAATLGGLPASANIIGEVWSDLALEELLPRNVGDTAAVRHLGGGVEEDAEDEAAGAEGERQEAQAVRAGSGCGIRATCSGDGGGSAGSTWADIARDPRAGSCTWGTASAHATQGRHDGRPRRRRRRDAYSDQSEDEAAEAEHDDPEQGYAHRDRVRYSFALPPATFTWTEADDSELDDDAEGSRELRAEPDGIGFPLPSASLSTRSAIGCCRPCIRGQRQQREPSSRTACAACVRTRDSSRARHGHGGTVQQMQTQQPT